MIRDAGKSSLAIHFPSKGRKSFHHLVVGGEESVQNGLAPGDDHEEGRLDATLNIVDQVSLTS
jgi:hypothetical protein